MKICDERLKPFSVLRFTVQVFLSAIECAECPEYTGTAFCQVSFWYEPIEASYPADDKEQEKSILQSLQSSWYKTPAQDVLNKTKKAPGMGASY